MSSRRHPLPTTGGTRSLHAFRRDDVGGASRPPVVWKPRVGRQRLESLLTPGIRSNTVSPALFDNPRVTWTRGLCLRESDREGARPRSRGIGAARSVDRAPALRFVPGQAHTFEFAPNRQFCVHRGYSSVEGGGWPEGRSVERPVHVGQSRRRTASLSS
jgi:hypothetical protein